MCKEIVFGRMNAERTPLYKISSYTVMFDALLGYQAALIMKENRTRMETDTITLLTKMIDKAREELIPA
jgi:hypothetical protein